MQWVLGEKRYVYTVASADGSSDLSYEIFDTSDETVVASGSADVSGATISFLWEPTVVGVYVARTTYTLNAEDIISSQVVEIKETM